MIADDVDAAYLKLQRERGKARYYARKAAGVCTLCGKKPPADGKTMCASCLERIREYGRKNEPKKRADRIMRYHERKAAGLCVTCGEKAREGRVTCEECGKKEREKQKGQGRSEARRRRYRELKAAGICVVCRKRPALPGRAMCAECAERRREYDEKRVLRKKPRRAVGGQLES